MSYLRARAWPVLLVALGAAPTAQGCAESGTADRGAAGLTGAARPAKRTRTGTSADKLPLDAEMVAARYYPCPSPEQPNTVEREFEDLWTPAEARRLFGGEADKGAEDAGSATPDAYVAAVPVKVGRVADGGDAGLFSAGLDGRFTPPLCGSFFGGSGIVRYGGVSDVWSPTRWEVRNHWGLTKPKLRDLAAKEQAFIYFPKLQPHENLYRHYNLTILLKLESNLKPRKPTAQSPKRSQAGFLAAFKKRVHDLFSHDAQVEHLALRSDDKLEKEGATPGYFVLGGHQVSVSVLWNNGFTAAKPRVRPRPAKKIRGTAPVAAGERASLGAETNAFADQKTLLEDLFRRREIFRERFAPGGAMPYAEAAIFLSTTRRLCDCLRLGD